jgi:signal transduction histidine kinase
MTAPERILTVDDEPLVRMNLRAFLEDQGYHVLEAGDGATALGVCATQAPDLVLLDVSMPGMDGFQVCERLRAEPASEELPVIFLTALPATADKVRAFQAGGVDYLTKPFQFEEVEARVRTHLELAQRRRQLRVQNAALMRSEALQQDLTHMIVHDMRSPLTAVLQSLEMLEAGLPPEPGGSQRALVELGLRGSRRLGGMIDQLLQVSRLEAGEMPVNLRPLDLGRLAQSAVAALDPRRISVAVPEQLQVAGDPDLLPRVLDNLLGNALKFTQAPGRVELRTGFQGCRVRIEVLDQGPGIADHDRERIFEKFAQGEAGTARQGLGLGLAFCRLAVERMGGQIGVESELGRGSTFWFTLPAG